MKKKIFIWAIYLIMAVLFVNFSYSQELNKLVNSPVALKIKEEIISLRDQSQKLLLVDENLKVKYRGQKKSENGEKNESAKFLLKDISSTEHKINSISDRISELRQLHANEILKSKRSQEIVKQMKIAVASGNIDKAVEIRVNYQKRLMEETTNKWLAKEIDRLAYRTETDAILEIDAALTTVVFPPIKKVEQIH
jgi:hypothetical protein